MKKILFIFLGGISFLIGTIGIVLPFLPTVPFYLLTAFLLMRSSEKLHEKFIHSKYYQHYVKTLLIEKKIDNKSLIRIFLTIFLVFLIPAVLVNNLLMRISLAILYVLHVILLTRYFKKGKITRKNKELEEL
ncbi:hypothetical protein SAMN02745116_00494 [Pilibacter termitis]|uniref:DUF454 domain-containing protein n=1 Tax=Pilibacter termitis TaxID=263852 RepID=A0A1T4L234_9ENTE|nr:YbaN family protein [Pilibacter termitis]SJZ48658.1 hypothetical protein SAMN02745116_00494 [Pilibacter termitis]